MTSGTPGPASEEAPGSCREFSAEEIKLVDKSTTSRCTGMGGHLQKDQDEALPNLVTLLKLTMGFFCVFFSFGTQQNIMATVLQEASGTGHLAYLSLALLYGVFMPSCLVVPSLLRSVNPRRVLPFGTFCYALYALAAAGPAMAGQSSAQVKMLANAGLLFAAVLIGASGAVVWICQGHIMTHISPQPLLNRYVSFFYTVFNFASICGAVAADKALKAFGSGGFFVFLFSVSAFGTIVICSIGTPSPHKDIVPEPVLQPHATRKELVKLVKEPFAFLRKDPRAVRLVCLGTALGFSMNAFTAAGLPQFVLARSGSSHHVAQALVGVGCGRVTASFAFGVIADCIGRRATLLLTLPSICCTVVLLVLEATPSVAYPMIGALPIPYGYMGAFFQGLTNGTASCISNACISGGFQGGDVKLGFALQYLSMCVTSVVGFILFPLISRDMALSLVSACIVLSVLFVAAHKPLFESGYTRMETSTPAPSTIGVADSTLCQDDVI